MNSERNNTYVSDAEIAVSEREKFEVTISELISVVLNKLWILILAGLIAAIGAYFFTVEFSTPTYRSTARIYILNRQNSMGTSISDLNSASTLKDDFMVLIRSRNVYREVLEKIGADPARYGSLSGKLSLGSSSDSRVVDMTITDTNPLRAKVLVDAFAEISRTTVKDLMAVEDIKIVFYGDIPTAPSNPSMKNNIVLGAGAGVVVAAAIIVLVHMFNDNIKTAKDIQNTLGISVLGSIPDVSLLRRSKSSPKKKQARK